MYRQHGMLCVLAYSRLDVRRAGLAIIVRCIKYVSVSIAIALGVSQPREQHTYLVQTLGSFQFVKSKVIAPCGRHQYGVPLRPWRFERAARQR
eukprot:4215465-Pleurochrysis_carterae.AAC.1